MFFLIFSILGIILAIYIALSVLCAIYRIFFPFFYLFPKNLHSLAGAKWALITGGTDGIGRAYVNELAKKQFNIIIISRSQSKLDNVAKEVKEEFKEIEVRTIAFDFTNPKLEDYEKNIFNKIDDIDIGILVNNVGMFNEYPERFEKTDIKHMTAMALCNMLPQTILSHYVLKQMLSRRKGIVVNISSTMGSFQWYYMAIYSASKKYAQWLSATLQDEYSSSGIEIQTVSPMFVATKMTKVSKPSFTEPTAVKFVRQAVHSIGLIKETTGCFAHQLMLELVSPLPKFAMAMFTKKMSLDMKDLYFKTGNFR
ncbi:hypothetical protein ACQ4LE_008440 [Meloidogyne hapla]|uniref:Hydroxysteroid 17-beta dehydrogenase 12 n=1 Tax=Meloidogyne hapla TaxID=6305 RepID=A0A1I8B312_MELHA